MNRAPIVLAFVFLLSAAAPVVGQETDLFSPGKIDFLYRHRPDADLFNAFAWTPVFKGGAGVIDLHNDEEIDFAGGYLRPFLGHDELGELILGGQTVARGDARDSEYQAEYRFPFGLGFGGGFVDRDDAGTASDLWFGKVTLRGDVGGWSYVLSAQLQEIDGVGDLTPGGYAALYNDQFMLVGGTDGEQWRVTGGWIAPKPVDGLFRPAAEVLYVDNSIGDLPGPRFLFANATLGFRGGFLSNSARLGRAMGPQGLEYGNPLGFLRPTWNRRLDVWELGGLVNFRLVRTEFPNGTDDTKIEALAYPFQFTNNESSILDAALFLGGFHHDDVEDRSSGILGGLSGRFGKMSLSAGVEYDFDRETTSATIGIIRWF